MATALSIECDGKHSHGMKLLHTLPRKVAEIIVESFTQTLKTSDPSRLVQLTRSLDGRLRGMGLFADEIMADLHQECRSFLISQERTPKKVFAIVEEGHDIPQDGIEFDIPLRISSHILLFLHFSAKVNFFSNSSSLIVSF